MTDPEGEGGFKVLLVYIRALIIRDKVIKQKKKTRKFSSILILAVVIPPHSKQRVNSQHSFVKMWLALKYEQD